jgi:ATP-dependent Lhr-like helicase
MSGSNPFRLHPLLESWFDQRGWAPFDFQREAWQAYHAGRDGLVHAPTGMGKTLSVWLGPVSQWLDEHPEHDPEGDDVDRAQAEPLRVLWITPLRALANDTLDALQQPIRDLGLPWTIEKRTGDTAQSVKAKQRQRYPTALVITPESLSVLLSYPDAARRLKGIRSVVVDEWHELLSSKRGTQTELCLARLRRWNPGLRTWGLSATLGNVEQAASTLVGSRPASEPVLIRGQHTKRVEIRSIVPDDIERFPWAGHLGLKILPEVISAIEGANSTLVFCNTRSQVEIWYGAIMQARPDWLGRVSLHHGSLDKQLRDKVEAGLRKGRAKCVVCTSSLDLGVDFSPVDLVLQIGSPKGVARLLQRAGRSGHQPGAVSTVLCVPTHAFELVEFAAARSAATAGTIEHRVPLEKPLDVLVQHLMTCAVGGGFEREAILDEVRGASSYADLSTTELGWALDFLTKGGAALGAYPEFKRVEIDGSGDTPRYVVRDRSVTMNHRVAIGTITSDSAMTVRWASGGGKSLGTIEESFISKLAPGNRFVFSGRVLELARVREMTAYVRRAKSSKGIVPRWGGGRSPLSTELSAAVREKLETFRLGDADEPELRAIAPLLNLQTRWSVLPGPDDLLIETTTTREGHHTFLFPFEGRLVHEGLGALLAFRLTRDAPRSLAVTVNDYGVELLSETVIDLDDARWRRMLQPEDLLADLLECLNSSQLARRRFRDIARIAGLIHPGFPGRQSKPSRHLQASSELFFDVFAEFDPANLLLDQAKREVLSEQLEVTRLRNALDRIADARIVMVSPECLTPLAFPLYAERLRTQTMSSESWRDRIERMVLRLEVAASRERDTLRR